MSSSDSNHSSSSWESSGVEIGASNVIVSSSVYVAGRRRHGIGALRRISTISNAKNELGIIATGQNSSNAPASAKMLRPTQDAISPVLGAILTDRQSRHKRKDHEPHAPAFNGLVFRSSSPNDDRIESLSADFVERKSVCPLGGGLGYLVFRRLRYGRRARHSQRVSIPSRPERSPIHRPLGRLHLRLGRSRRRTGVQPRPVAASRPTSTFDGNDATTCGGELANIPRERQFDRPSGVSYIPHILAPRTFAMRLKFQFPISISWVVAGIEIPASDPCHRH